MCHLVSFFLLFSFQLPYLLPSLPSPVHSASFPTALPGATPPGSPSPAPAPPPPRLYPARRTPLGAQQLVPGASHPHLTRAPRPFHRLNRDGGLPRRSLQGASTRRPRPSGHASLRPSSLSRQAPQAAVLVRGLHGGKEKKTSFSEIISISGFFFTGHFLEK